MVLTIDGLQGNYYVIAKCLFRKIFSEIQFHSRSTRYLTRDEFRALRRYYSSWMKSSIGEFHGHYFARRIKNAVKLIIELRSTKPSVLDCGCGFGSESIAFGLLGAKVIGVDLSKERIKVASKRLKYYKDRHSNELNINFKNMNILDLKCNELFDVVYAKEFITHIYSVSRFVKFANKVLKKTGHLVITDANPLNPLVCYKAYKAHKNGLYKVVKDPRTEKEIPNAVERLISPVYLRSLLRQNNFQPRIEFYGILPPLPLGLSSIIKLFEVKTNIPVLGLYEIVSMKNYIKKDEEH